MAIPYSGSTLINFTFTDAATRRSLVDNLATQLALAGWSYVSGSGTGDVLMESAATAQGNKIRFRLLDPGSGNCAQFTMKDTSLTSSIAYLLPNTRNWRIVANQHQFFMFVTGGGNADIDRGSLMGGVPWAPSFVTGPYFGWMMNVGTSDTVSSGQTFRKVVGVATLSTTSSWLYNGILSNAPNNGAGVQCPLLRSVSTSALGYRWEDGSPFIIEAMLAWAYGATTSGEVRVKGMLWDAVIVMLEYTGETVISFDGHTWIAITHNASSSGDHSTLFIAIT